jgi:hypothetical protein
VMLLAPAYPPVVSISIIAKDNDLNLATKNTKSFGRKITPYLCTFADL